MVTKRGILVLALIMACLLLAHSINLGTSAYFSDTEVSMANAVFAGTWESLTVKCADGDGKWNSPHWTVSMYAGEKKSTTITLANSSADDIEVTMLVSPASFDSCNLTFSFDKSVFTVPAQGETNVVFWVEASQSVKPDTYSTVITIER